MAKIIACTHLTNTPVYINLDNVLIIDQPGAGAHFHFVSDAKLTVNETLDDVARAIRGHGPIIEASASDEDNGEVTRID